jgi:hypothetical protein
MLAATPAMMSMGSAAPESPDPDESGAGVAVELQPAAVSSVAVTARAAIERRFIRR